MNVKIHVGSGHMVKTHNFPKIFLWLHLLFSLLDREDPTDLETGAQHIMRYSAIAPLLNSGAVSLLWNNVLAWETNELQSLLFCTILLSQNLIEWVIKKITRMLCSWKGKLSCRILVSYINFSSSHVVIVIQERVSTRHWWIVFFGPTKGEFYHHVHSR